MRVLGIDGCKQGWVCVVLEDGRFVEAFLEKRFEDLLGRAEGASVIAVDMPIGLLATGWRTCDRAVKECLGPRRASGFLVPPRDVLMAASYEQANVRCRELTDKGISKQSYALAPKILEVDPIAARDSRIHEVHPEATFKTMADGAVLASKKSWSGARSRLGLLERAGIELPAEIGEAGLAAADDVMDAAACAWSATRIDSGQGRRFPESEREADPVTGRDIVIWA